MKRGTKIGLAALALAWIAPSAVAVDYASPYLPEISTFRVNALAVSGGRLSAQVSLKVKIHRNSVAWFRFTWAKVGGSVSAFEPVCTTTREFILTSAAASSSNPDLVLVSRQANADWFDETFATIAATMGRDQNPLCAGQYSLRELEIVDAAVRHLRIYNLSPAPFQVNYSYTAAPALWASLGENSPYLPCESLDPRDPTRRSVCNQAIDFASFDFLVPTGGGTAAPLPPLVDVLADAKAEQNRLSNLVTGLQTQLKTAQDATAEAQAASKALAAERADLQSQLKSLQDSVAALQAQFKSAQDAASTAQVQAKAVQAALVKANARIAKICGSRPKPKGC